eukprot:631898_1
MSLHVVIVFTATLIHYATATVYSDHITGPGTMLYRGDRIESTSKNSRFSMQQTDGNLVLYNATNGPPFVAIWSTHTINATYTEITNDGNITVKDDNGRIYWSSNSGGHNASEYYLVVMDFCAYLMDPYYTVLWSTCEDACNVIYPTFEPPTSNGDTLVPTTQPTHCNCSDTAFDPKPTPLYMDHASTSANHSFFLYPLDRISSRSLNTYATLQTDGNFVLYVDEGCRHKAIWSTNTQNKDAKYVVLMRNGNLKVMGKNGTVLFKSDTYGGYSRPQPQHLVVTDECMYLMDGDYTMYWHQGSGCTVFNGAFPTFSAPTAEPSPTKQPTTIQPTLSPTVYPTITPTLPTSEPTKITIFPTIFPTQIPTTIPTKVPTKSTSDPTKIPTNAPITAKPTDITTFPTVFQTQNPTKTPTKVPIKLTADPTNTLTNAPITDDPTMFVIISSTYKATESDQEEDVHKEENLYFEYLMDENIIQIYDEKDWQNYQQDVKTFKQRVLHCKNMQFPSPQKVTSTQNAVCANSHHAISQQPSPHNLFSATAPLTPALEAIHEQQSMGFWQRNQNQNPQHSLMDELPIAGSGSNAVSGLLSTGSAKMQNPVQKEMKLDEYCMKKDPYNTCFDMMTKRTSNL